MIKEKRYFVLLLLAPQIALGNIALIKKQQFALIYIKMQKYMQAIIAILLICNISAGVVYADKMPPSYSQKTHTASEAEASNKYTITGQDIDDLLIKIHNHAGSYPPRFDNKEQKKEITSLLLRLLGILAKTENTMDIDLQLRRGYAFAMAHNLDIKGSAQNAEESFQKALAINSNHSVTNHAYARFLESTNTWSYKAIPIYEKLINMGPGFALYKKDLARVHTLNSNNEMAIKLLQEYVKLYPQDEEAAKMLNALENGAVEVKTRPGNIKVTRYNHE